VTQKSTRFFEIDKGILWLYPMHSKTAEEPTALIKKFDIPNGGYLGFVPIADNKSGLMLEDLLL
jgi:hypothetical protein